VTNYNIRVPNLYIWGRKSRSWERDVGGKRYVGNFAIFCKSINLVLDNFIIFSQISLCLRDIWRGKPCKRLMVHVTFVNMPTQRMDWFDCHFENSGTK